MWIAKVFVMSGESCTISDAEQREALITYIKDNAEAAITFTIQRGKRTARQNNALHAYCREVAKQMEARGYDMREVLKPTVEITPTLEIVKDHIWKPVQESVTGRSSTTDLTTKEVDAVYQIIAKHLATKFDITVPFGKEIWE